MALPKPQLNGDVLAYDEMQTVEANVSATLVSGNTGRITVLERFWSDPQITSANGFNDVIFSGTYVVNRALSDSPITGIVYGIITVVATAVDWLFQDLWLTDNRRFRRVKTSGGFTSWEEY